MTTPNFVYNLWVLDSYGKPHFYTQCDSSEAIDKRASDFKKFFPKEKYLTLYITLCPYVYRLLAWDGKLWEDYHENYMQVANSVNGKKKGRVTKKKPAADISK